MRDYHVFIEQQGEQIYVGKITGSGSEDAVFSYAQEYLDNPSNCPISIHLPLQAQNFSTEETRLFFEGLLPEGFTRKCVAGWIHADEYDYLTILAALGRECLGAIQIIEDDMDVPKAGYQKLTKEDVCRLAKEGASEAAELVTKAHLSLTGASGKVGLYYKKDTNEWYLPIGAAPSTHIVKQSHVRLDGIVTNEQLCLQTAKNLGIDVPDSFVINVGTGKDEDVLFATHRYDRIIDEKCRVMDGLTVPFRLHQEDFSQAMGISSGHKYEHNGEGYLKRMCDILKKYSPNPMEDQLKLWDICVFNYLIGNTDNHIKNVSLLYASDMASIRLAPAYDIVCTMIYPSSTTEMAVSIGCEYDIHKIKREHFCRELKNIGIGEKLAMKHYDDMLSRIESALEESCETLMQQGFIQAKDMKKRILEVRKPAWM